MSTNFRDLVAFALSQRQWGPDEAAIWFDLLRVFRPQVATAPFKIGGIGSRYVFATGYNPFALLSAIRRGTGLQMEETLPRRAFSLLVPEIRLVFTSDGLFSHYTADDWVRGEPMLRRQLTLMAIADTCLLGIPLFAAGIAEVTPFRRRLQTPWGRLGYLDNVFLYASRPFNEMGLGLWDIDQEGPQITSTAVDLVGEYTRRAFAEHRFD